ncbi:MAG: hypothetical protein WCG30_03945 [Candidatus Saccharibacteria bacterium]
MKLFKKPTILAGILSLFTLLTTTVFAGSISANANCLYNYNPKGFDTSATPVFNSICNVPDLGNEPNFVRIRQNTNGNDMDNAHNPSFTSAGLTSSCAVGTKFDIWNYLHNDASPAYNPDKNAKNPSAVAKNVTTYLSAGINTPGNTFKFGDMITAYNAKGVSSNVSLNCNGQKVKLQLVPSSLNVFSSVYGKWMNQPNGDSLVTVNGTKGFSLGATNLGDKSFGSGQQWGCWDYRIVVVYQVEVQAAPDPIPATCDLLKLENNNGVAKVDVNYTANDSAVNTISLLINGQTVSLKPSQLPYSFNMNPGSTYNVSATLNYALASANGSTTSKTCSGSISTTKLVSPTPPTRLVNTGPGDVVAVFIAAVISGYTSFRFYLKKKILN